MVDSVLDAFQVGRLSVDENFAGDFLAVALAEQRHGKFGSTRAHQASQTHDLTGTNLDIDVLQYLAVAIVRMVDIPVLDREDHVTDGAILPLGVTVGQLTADHALDDPLFGEVVHALVEGLNGAAVTDDGDGISHIADLVKLVGNDDAGQALGLQLQHQLQQLGGFLIVQSRGWLVQNQQVSLFTQCLGNFDQLLLAHAQRVDRHVHVLISQTYTTEQILGLLPGLGPVDDPILLPLVANEHILRNGQEGTQSQLLVDDNDALFLGLADVVKFADLAVVDDVACVFTIGVNAGKNIHQGGLACTVLAADSHDFTLAHFQIYIVQCLDPGELLGNVVHFQNIF